MLSVPRPPRIGPYRWRDFLRLDEDDTRELIDGELVETDMPTQSHELVVGLLVFFLTSWARARKAGRVLGSGYRVRISDVRGAVPDVQFFREGNLPLGQEQGLERGRPDLAVEVVSPTSRAKDYVTRVHDYAALGVPEYWIVDPEARTLERLVLRDGMYCIAEALTGAALFRPGAFEGLEIPLAELWAET